MTASKTVLTGGCQCGAIRYSFPKDAVLTLYCCHCLECQHQSASAFGMSLWVARAAFRLTKGRPVDWQRTTDRGTVNRAKFCPDCGARLYHEDSPEAASISLKAGGLDDTSWLRPAGHIWASRAQPWVTLDPRLLIYPEEPQSFDPLIAAYQAG